VGQVERSEEIVPRENINNEVAKICFEMLAKLSIDLLLGFEPRALRFIAYQDPNIQRSQN